MVRKCILVWLSGALMILASAAIAKEKGKSMEWKPPADRPFPILAWLGPYGDIITDPIVADMAKAGFNLWHMQGAYSETETRRALDLGKKHGIGILVRDPSMDCKPNRIPTDASIEKAVDRWKAYPALAGYAIKDEPVWGDFPEIARIRQTLARLDPGRLVYVNLAPSRAGRKRLGGSYPEHVDSFIKTFQPTVLSFDEYPITHHASRIRGQYYSDLEIIRAAALEAKVPFWAFTLSTAHANYPEPTEGHLRFQLYSDLVYGAKGLQYFTYCRPRNKGFKGSLIDRQGNRRDIWNLAAKINGEIQNMGPVLLSLTSTEVFHTDPCPRRTRKFKAHGGLAACSGGPAVLGFFDGPKDQKWLMVVNRKFFESAEMTITFSDDVKSIGELDRTKKGGVVKQVELKNRKFKLPLGAGDGRLFRVNTIRVRPKAPIKIGGE